MNEEYLLGAYNSFGGQEKLGVDFNAWVQKIKNNDDYKQGMFNHFGGESTLKADYDTWNSKVFGDVKKKRRFRFYCSKSRIGFGTAKWFFGYTRL
jgi:hypothetical protein